MGGKEGRKEKDEDRETEAERERNERRKIHRNGEREGREVEENLKDLWF